MFLKGVIYRNFGIKVIVNGVSTVLILFCKKGKSLTLSL